MLKQTRGKYLSTVTIAILAMVGCGEILDKVEDRPAPPTDEPVNKGHYVDENVSGIHYKTSDGYYNTETGEYVKTQIVEGTTTVNGSYGYIPGSSDGVEFSVAGLYLDYIPAKYLVKNGVVTVGEHNGKLASFLQSMDNDGNASNGINITPEVVEALNDLNVSGQYGSSGIYAVEDVSLLVSQVQEILNRKASETASPTSPTTSPGQGIDKLTLSKIQLRYVDESEALAHLQATIAKHTTQPSITVKKVIEDIKDIVENAQSYTEGDIESKIDAIKAQLNNPLSEDKGLVDIAVAKALVDISELTNESYLEDLFIFEGGDTTSKLSQIIKEITLSPADPLKDTIVKSREANAVNVIADSKKAIISTANSLKAISDRLEESLASAPQYYKFEYEGISLTIDNILALRATLLAVASQLNLAAAYNVGNDTNYLPKTYTDATGATYRYDDTQINEDKMLNQAGFGTATDQTALNYAKSYLMESAMILKKVDADKVRSDLNESRTLSPDEYSSQSDIINYASKLYKVLSDNKGTFEFVDENGGRNDENVTYTTAINRLFSTATASKVSDFGTNWKYQSCPDGMKATSEEEAIKYAERRFCYPTTLPQGDSLWNYRGCEVEIYATNNPEAETSGLDELITQIKVGQSVKTGEELVNYIIDPDENRGVSYRCGGSYQPQFTYEKVAGKTDYAVAEDGSSAVERLFAALGNNTLQLKKPYRDSNLSDPKPFTIENGKIIINYSDNSGREEVTLLAENIEGKYDRVNVKFYYNGSLSDDRNYRTYYNVTDADNYLDELKNFKYLGSNASDTFIISSPNGGETITTGDSSKITWRQDAISSSNVKLYILADSPYLNAYNDLNSLLSSKNWVQLNDSQLVTNSGEYTPTSEEKGYNGNAYVVLIASEDGTQWDVSDSTFSINP